MHQWILIIILISGVDGWGTKKSEMVKTEFTSQGLCEKARAQIVLNDWHGGSAVTQAYCVQK